MVSVITATYRRDRTLARAIESVLNQTYGDIELIVIDDNADAYWNERVKGIAERFNAVKYIRNPENKGSAASRNIGIENARGEYITFLDDDDVYLPCKVEHQLEALIKSDADFSVTDLFLYNENDRLIDKRIRNYIHSYDKEALLVSHLMHHITGTDTLMFKAEYLKKTGGFPSTDIGDEFYLMEKAISGGGKFIYTPGCFVKAYIHKGEESGLSSGLAKIQGENALYEYKKGYFNRIGKKARRYIVCRHHAVLAFAYLRMKKAAPFLAETVKAFLASPVSCIKILIGAER